MARARSNGGAYAWALVVFGCGFVVALLVAIIFYTKIEQAKVAQAEAEQELRSYINVAQDSADIQPYLTSGSNNSAFREMKNLIVQLQSDLEFRNAQIAELERAVAEANTSIEREQSVIEDREAELTRQQAQSEAALQEAVDRARQLETELAALTQDRNQISQDLAATMRNANESAQQQIDALNADLLAANTETAQAENAYEQLLIDYRRLEGMRDEILVPDVTTADGEVLSVFNDGGQLFINRGRAQGVMLGLTFEVFDANEVIRLDSSSNSRGKATIEVYELRDDTAACRVVRRSRGAQVIAGDVIANIVYDPTKEFTFYAYGYFDIEFDGGASDIRRIENLVTQWGASVAELQLDEDGLPILSPEIDYLILGQQPEYPDPLDDDELDPEVIREWQVQVRQFETYQALLGDAKTLGIPILNQNRFLDLVGYYVR